MRARLWTSLLLICSLLSRASSLTDPSLTALYIRKSGTPYYYMTGTLTFIGRSLTGYIVDPLVYALQNYVVPAELTLVSSSASVSYSNLNVGYNFNFSGSNNTLNDLKMYQLLNDVWRKTSSSVVNPPLFQNSSYTFYTNLNVAINNCNFYDPFLSSCPLGSTLVATGMCQLCSKNYYTPVNYTGTLCLPCPLNYYTQFRGDAECLYSPPPTPPPPSPPPPVLRGSSSTLSGVVLANGPLLNIITLVFSNRTLASFNNTYQDLTASLIQATALPWTAALVSYDSITSSNGDVVAKIRVTYNVSNVTAGYVLFNAAKQKKITLFRSAVNTFFTGLNVTLQSMTFYDPNLVGCPRGSVYNYGVCNLCALNYYTPSANYTSTTCLACSTDYYTSFIGDAGCHISVEDEIQNALSNKWVILGMVSGLSMFAFIIIILAFCSTPEDKKYS